MDPSGHELTSETGDGNEPCKSCRRAGRQCTSTDDAVSFRHDHNPSINSGATCRARLPSSTYYGKDHKWASIPSSLVFIQQDAASILAESEFPWEQFSPERKASPEVARGRGSVPRPESPRNSDRHIECLPSSPPPACNPRPSLWPLMNRDESMLICYFINDVAPWLDYIDPWKHFSTTAVQASAEHEIIKYAIFAISAKMLSVSNRWDPIAADRYQAQCLQLFIPAFRHKDPTLEGDFLCATTLILRLYDELTNPSADRCPHKHILNTDIFIRAQDPNKSGYSLCQSSLFVAMRQETGLAAYTGTAPPSLAAHCGVPRTLGAAKDYIWMWRLLAHTEHVLRYVYGEDSSSTKTWDSLHEYLQGWRERRPTSFDPIWKAGDEAVEFPEMWFANDYHVAGQQYADICEMLLVLHDPRTPTTGLGRMEASRDIEHKVKKLVRRICGVALSNKKHLPAMSTAGISIVTCGDRLTETYERKVALEILSEYEDIVQWPALRAQERLRALWNI
ncbi:hypothetical protein CC79DRAFT_1366338 [Sarocladium strictum]